MKHAPVLLTLALSFAGALTGHSQTSPTPTPTAVRPPVEVSGPTERVSRTTADAVSSRFSYQTPKPAEPKAPEPVEEEPKNGIVRLPSYIVEGYRPPVFSERDINTNKGLSDVAVRRYLGEVGTALNSFSLPFFGMSKEQYAMMRYEEEERLRNMKETNESIYLLRQTDPVGAERLKRDADSTFIRKGDFNLMNGSGR